MDLDEEYLDQLSSEEGVDVDLDGERRPAEAQDEFYRAHLASTQPRRFTKVSLLREDLSLPSDIKIEDWVPLFTFFFCLICF